MIVDGVVVSIPTYMIEDAALSGFNLESIARVAIKKMLQAAGLQFGDFSIRMQVENPHCDQDECIFRVRIAKKKD